MSIELTITPSGEILLPAEVLAHLGVRPGETVNAVLLPGSRVALSIATGGHDIRALRGILRRPGQRPLTLREMQEAIEAGAAGEPDP